MNVAGNSDRRLRIQIPDHVSHEIEGFTGRTWLLAPLLTWVEQSSERSFVVTGEPGSGKSMLSAWLAGSGPAPADPVARRQLDDLRAQVAIHPGRVNFPETAG